MKLIVLSLALIAFVFGQNIETKGHLIKLHFNSDASVSDTLLSLHSDKNGYDYFYKAFDLNGKPKLLYSYENYYSPYFSKFCIVDVETEEFLQFSIGNHSCIFLYGAGDSFYKVKNGILFCSERAWLFMLSNDNTLKYSYDEITPKIIHILGKFNNQFLIAYEELGDDPPNTYFQFAFSKLENDPDFETERITLPLNHNSILRRVEQVDSQHILFDNGKLILSEFSDNNFTFVDTIDCEANYWNVINQSLYTVNKTSDSLQIKKSKFINNQFYDFELLFESKLNSTFFEFDHNNKHLVFGNNDSLYVYGLASEKIIANWDISEFGEVSRPLIDSPYVYLHRTTKFLSVDNSNKSPNAYALSAYPNPFNPSTTIQFNLPVTEKVKIEIFNTVGELISTLYDDIKESGSYKVIFSPDNLSSGLYICRVKTDTNIFTKKLLLIR